MTPEELAVEFPLGPDSLPLPGVPQGKLEKFTWAQSKIFPGTVRDCWIYVPAQYDATKPVCVLVVQDGEAHWSPERRWHIPTILDNLIHQQVIPVMIGIFINPGVVPASVAGGAPRINRSFEYDSLGDRYARFLHEEILPEVGRRYSLAQDGNSRAIMGGSSGAFCALNVAWQRPDAFSRVLSIVGSYTAMRSGHTLASLVRLTEPKRLRVFLESGGADFKIYAGDWFAANQDMLSALTYAGYEVHHSWADKAGHNDFHGSSIFPAALRWLWHDYPSPVRAGKSSQPVMQVLIPGEPWQRVEGDYPSATVLATNSSGGVFFASPENECVYRIASDGVPQMWARKVAQVSAMAFGPDDALYGSQPGKRRIVKFDANGKMSVWLKNIAAAGLGFTAKGDAYVSEPEPQKLWLVTPDRVRSGQPLSSISRLGLQELGADPFSAIVSPWVVQMFGSGGQLIVSDAHGPASWLFTVQPDGTLADRAPYFRPIIAEGEINPGVTAIAVSPKGWPVFATTAGVQLGMKSGGLITGLIPAPSGEPLDGVAFGGAGFDQLYASDGKRIFRRKISVPDELWG